MTAESQSVRPARPSAAPADASSRLEAAVREHRTAVFAVCLAYTRDPHEAEDRTQEVFLKALSKIDSVRDPRSIRPWLLQVARRDCIDHSRRRGPATQPLPDVAAPASGTAEEAAWLLSAIDGLPAEDREILALYYLDGRACPSIARDLDLTPAAVRQRLVRARLRLHDILVEAQR